MSTFGSRIERLAAVFLALVACRPAQSDGGPNLEPSVAPPAGVGASTGSGTGSSVGSSAEGSREPSAAAPSSGPMAATRAAPACPPPAPRAAWRHRRSALLTSLGASFHGSVDALALPGATVELEAKLSYGPTTKDLEDEDVSAWLAEPSGGTCPTWRSLGTRATSRDGRVAIDVTGPKQPGPQRVAFVVAGDGSQAASTLWVVAPETRAVIFDIDGTLTAGDEVLADQLVHGISPAPRAGAVAAAAAFAAKGQLVIYLTGRPDFLGEMTRRWLAEHGFPSGPVLMTTTSAASVPSRDGVQRFKTDRLRAIKALGVSIERAYGNAPTDICAYAEAGIAPAATFILGPHGGEACAGHAATVALGEGYPAP